MSELHVLAPGEGQVVAVPGASMVFKLRSGQTAGDYIVAEFTAAPGFAGPRPHAHRQHEEQFYLLEGELEFFIDDRVVRLGPGAFLNVPAGVVHDFRNVGTTPARCLAIASPGGLDRYFLEVQALAQSGQLTEEALRDLRLRYDTDELAELPANHWAARQQAVASAAR